MFLLKKQQNNFETFEQKILNKNVEIIAKIDDITNLVDSKMNYKITLEIEKMKEADSQWQLVNKKIQIFANFIKNLEIEDRINIKDLKFIKNNNNLYKEYLIKENLFASVFIYKFIFKTISKQKFTLKKTFHNLKNQILENLKAKMSDSSFALFSSIFLGNKNCSKVEINTNKELFKIWGLSHYLARSGLHLVIVSSVWFFLLSVMFFKHRTKNILIILLMFLYHNLSWPSIPFMRSLFMFFLYKTCALMNLQLNSLHFLNITTLFILIANPMQLFFLDFQLSFGLTYALIWLSRLTSKN